MFTKFGHHIGDTWYVTEPACIHMFYLTCPLGVKRHTRWSIGHASSANLLDWQDHGIVLEPGDAAAWDGICPATGSVTKFDGQYYMAYTGNFAGPIPTVGLAVSPDLHAWSKCSGNPVTGIDGILYSKVPNRAWGQPRWRDPFLYQEHDRIYQLVTAAKPGAREDADGTIAVAVTDDMMDWQLLPPLDLPEIAQDLECPKLHRIASRYYLTVSVNDQIAGPALRSRQPAGLPIATAYCLVADRFEGPYVLHGSGRILKTITGSWPYACEPVMFNCKWYLLGTVWNDQGLDCVCDPIPIEPTPEGWREQHEKSS